MTKPDLLGAGAVSARSLWMDILEGRQHPLYHGYFCTRQLDDAERLASVDSARARELETEFFRTTQPKDTFERTRLGIANLVDALAKLLQKYISDMYVPQLADSVRVS